MTPAPGLRQKPLLALEHLLMLSSVPMQSTLVRAICVKRPISLSVTAMLLSAEDICIPISVTELQLKFTFHIISQLATYHPSIISVPEVKAHQTPSTSTAVFNSSFILHVSRKLNQPHVSVIAFYDRSVFKMPCY